MCLDSINYNLIWVNIRAETPGTCPRQITTVSIIKDRATHRQPYTLRWSGPSGSRCGTRTCILPSGWCRSDCRCLGSDTRWCLHTERRRGGGGRWRGDIAANTFNRDPTWLLRDGRSPPQVLWSMSCSPGVQSHSKPITMSLQMCEQPPLFRRHSFTPESTGRNTDIVGSAHVKKEICI